MIIIKSRHAVCVKQYFRVEDLTVISIANYRQKILPWLGFGPANYGARAVDTKPRKYLPVLVADTGLFATPLVKGLAGADTADLGFGAAGLLAKGLGAVDTLELVLVIVEVTGFLGTVEAALGTVEVKATLDATGFGARGFDAGGLGAGLAAGFGAVVVGLILVFDTEVLAASGLAVLLAMGLTSGFLMVLVAFLTAVTVAAAPTANAPAAATVVKSTHSFTSPVTSA